MTVCQYLHPSEIDPTVKMNYIRTGLPERCDEDHAYFHIEFEQISMTELEITCCIDDDLTGLVIEIDETGLYRGDIADLKGMVVPV